MNLTKIIDDFKNKLIDKEITLDDLHKENEENSDKRAKIDKIYREVYEYYKEKQQGGELDFKKERLLLESEKTYYDSPIINNLISLMIAFLAAPLIPNFIEKVSKILNNNILENIITLFMWGLFIWWLFVLFKYLILKPAAKAHLSYENRKLYYSICLDVLDSLENN